METEEHISSESWLILLIYLNVKDGRMELKKDR